MGYLFDYVIFFMLLNSIILNCLAQGRELYLAGVLCLYIYVVPEYVIGELRSD